MSIVSDSNCSNLPLHDGSRINSGINKGIVSSDEGRYEEKKDTFSYVLVFMLVNFQPFFILKLFAIEMES
jgi:hypothetical protein